MVKIKIEISRCLKYLPCSHFWRFLLFFPHFCVYWIRFSHFLPTFFHNFFPFAKFFQFEFLRKNINFLQFSRSEVHQLQEWQRSDWHGRHPWANPDFVSGIWFSRAWVSKSLRCNAKVKQLGKCTVFENHSKSLIQHCERSELRLHFEWTKVD